MPHDDHQIPPTDRTLRVKALESLLVQKGLVDPAALDVLIDTYEHKIGPRNGARVVARAWVDAAYKERLLRDATAAIAELGYGGSQGEDMVVVENTPEIHNLVVCTLCSIPVAFCVNLVWSWQTTLKFAFGIVQPKCGILYFPRGLRGARG